MPLYQIDSDRLAKLAPVRFSAQGIQERRDLQRLLLLHLDAVCPDTIPLCEEFGNWEESRRRIDILGLDKEGNLVVIELKRTETGGHMELQAVRYAAMVSEMTFEQAVETHRGWMNATGRVGDAEQVLLEHLGLDEPNEETFGKEVRIVLVAADFSKEVTTTALWLAQHGVDVSCVRLRPYEIGEKLVLDVQRLIPLPEAAEYTERVRHKQQAERKAREQKRDYTKFDVRLEDEWHLRLPKRQTISLVVRHLCSKGVSPEDIHAVIDWKPSLWLTLPGKLDVEAFASAARARQQAGGPAFAPNRWFCGEGELVHAGDSTYAFTNQWGGWTEKAVRLLIEAWPDLGVEVRVSDEAS